jgi:4-amino-4-deoxy-L-arabinose transferase-like glycosyltransferase
MDRSDVRRTIRHHALILLTAGLVFFTNLGSAALFDEDEPKNAVCGREMFLRGDWIVPTFNQELRTDKPILIYWMMLGSYSAFGVNEFAARFGSSVLAVLTAVFVYHLGRLLCDREAGLWASVVLCTCLMYAAVGRAATPDSTLICCVTGTFLAYVWAVAKRHGGRFGAASTSERGDAALSPLPTFRWGERARVRGAECDTRPLTLALSPADGGEGTRLRWDEFVPARWYHALPMAVAMGLAVLAKGPVGVVLPTGILGVFLLILQQVDARREAASLPTGAWWRRWIADVASALHPLRIWRAFWALRLPLVFAVAALVALPWYLAVGQATGGDWLTGFLGGHNVGRFLQPMENHSGPFFYYLPVIALGAFPWSVFLPLPIWKLTSELRRSSESTASLILIACWAGVWIAFFSCASTKLPNYVLPAYPALALLTGWFLREWRHAPGHELAKAFRNCCWVLAATGVLMLIGIPIALSMLLPSETWLSVIGAVPLAGAGIAYGHSLRQHRLRAVRVLSIAAVCLAVLMVGIAPARVARHQDGPHFGQWIRDQYPADEVRLATFDYFSPNLVFYAADKVHRLKPPQFAEFFAEHPHALLLTRSDRLDQLTTDLPDDVEVLARQRRFLRRHDLVLLGRPPQTVQPASHTVIR